MLDSLKQLYSRLHRLFHGSPKGTLEDPSIILIPKPIEEGCDLRSRAPISPAPQESPREMARRILAEIDAEHPIKSVEEHAREEWLPKPRARRRRIPRRRPRRPGAQITSEDIGRLMHGKGKHQHATYRASVKARIQPEDD